MFRIASLLPRPPILFGLILACLYVSVPSSADAMAPAMGVAAVAWTDLDPSLAPLAILAAALGSAGLALRLRQRRASRA